MMWGYYGEGYPMMQYGSGSYAASQIVHLVFSVFWMIILVAIIITLIRFLRGKNDWHRHLRGNSALEILRERYAKGEISREEFEEKKKDLS